MSHSNLRPGQLRFRQPGTSGYAPGTFRGHSSGGGGKWVVPLLAIGGLFSLYQSCSSSTPPPPSSATFSAQMASAAPAPASAAPAQSPADGPRPALHSPAASSAVTLDQDGGGYFSNEDREMLSLANIDPAAFCGAHPRIMSCLAAAPDPPDKVATFRFASPVHPEHGTGFVLSADHAVVHVVDTWQDLPAEVQQSGIEVRSGSFATVPWTADPKKSAAPLIFWR